MILIKNIEVYSPEHLGKKDILIASNKIVSIDENIDINSDMVQTIDGNGKILLPGLIDQHVHITGGGGEGSFKTRVPEATLSVFTKSGITTVVGLLGTDSTTRSVENLVSKAKALKEEGLSVYAHTGSYEYPTVTLTGSVKKDIAYIDEIIGAKIAVSDHRSPHVSDEEFARLASDVRVAGMLAGKAGILVVHMGNGKDGLGIINRVLEKTEIPIRTIRPTHVNRKEELLFESFEFAKKGGVIDLTCGIYDDLSPANAIKMAVENKVPTENITISSDGYGSWSKYDEFGNMVKIGVCQPGNIYNEFVKMVNEMDFNIEDAIKYFTKNIANAIGAYPQKGIIANGSDADILIVDKSLEIDTVIANGKMMVGGGNVIVKGTYEA